MNDVFVRPSKLWTIPQRSWELHIVSRGGPWPVFLEIEKRPSGAFAG